jgi:replicative DNA helicase
MRKEIEGRGLKCLALDPLYLSIMAGRNRIDPKNMFEFGPVLVDMANLCLGAGCTPIIAHHFVKKRDDAYAPPELAELAYSGIGQFMRQWILLSRRERFDPESGVHKLFLNFGGSAGHCGEYALDIETGRLEEDFGGRKWNVTVSNPSDEQKARRERKSAEKAQVQGAKKTREECDLIATLVVKLNEEPGHKATSRRIRGLTGWNADKANRIVTLAEVAGKVRPVQVPIDMGHGRSRDFPGYELVENGETMQ